ncbi:MAG TPA: thioredoxin domain-containing protein, partial [Chitinophagaceae bacterium]|nr:thioredoxin domain-containing protein [Chitinophagaceae bacterium]
MSTHPYTNHLIHETSIYLLQHAHNPVNWYPWSEEAFTKAMTEDKPVLVSIGYAACHWCHVMERESFEDAATAAIMNENFINIKIDREERPDLDHIYMDAVQAMTGSGGWPLNIFLTPDKKPFYGGTYFPPVRAFNRASWKETLDAVYEAYKKRKHEITAQADNLTAYIKESNSFGMRSMDETQAAEFFAKEILQQAADNILKSADKVWGGFGKAPKFPQTFTIMFLLRHYYFTKHGDSLQQALLSLDKMIQGGMYDQLGGGFARYSTDDKWLAPHFEKMLYDNALLLSALAEAYQLTADEKYKEAILHTITFIEREMITPDGGFYSALDADSEGVEGKFYVWQKEEIDEVLGRDSKLFCSIYDVSTHGNWEHTNILWLKESLEWHAQQMNINAEELKQKLDACKEKLLQQRAQRIRPVTDDKIITGWNSLMITALCKCYAASGNTSYLQLAENNIHFLEKNCRNEKGKWLHTFKNGVAKYNAFLDDYSYLIQAYLYLQQATGDAAYLSSATELA